MDAITKLYVEKVAHTFADDLVVHGVAQLGYTLLKRQANDRAQVRIIGHGSYTEITFDPPLEQSTIDSCQEYPLHLIKAIKTSKNVDSLPSDIPSVSYEEEKERREAFFAARKNKLEGVDSPHPHWDIFRAINPSALSGYNSLVTNWWNIRNAQPEVIRLIFELFSQMPNGLDRAIDKWKALDKAHSWKIAAEATCQQLYNPDRGKGHNSPKSSGLSIGNVKNFWLLEWLKAVGFYEAAITRQVRGAKDRKTFVVSIRELSVRDHQAVINRFVDTMQVSETSIKFDILAAIRYTQALLEYMQEKQIPEYLRGRAKPITQKLVRGFQTAFYKNLGNATATMNLSFIALPGWVVIGDGTELSTYAELLTEIEKATRQFDEAHSDAFNLLMSLREFVSGDNLDAFLEFTTAYPAYLMGKREQGKYAYQFSIHFIERLIMMTEKRLYPILQSQGFQNIAYAIRQSTVTAQYRKKQGERKYDVRYGLGQELSRKARRPDDFIAALAEFLHNYNAENAQVMETRQPPFRRSVQTSDIDEIVMLIDEYGSETVARLLIAYGYARVPREDDLLEEQPEEEQLEIEEGE